MQMEKNLNRRATSFNYFFKVSSLCQHFLLMISFFLLKLLDYTDGNAMYCSEENANIVINRLSHDFFLIIHSFFYKNQ